MSPKQLKVGIWCAYHITLEASEGIGVFAHNIARGLSANDRVREVHLVCRPGDKKVLLPTVAKGNGKILAKPLPRNRFFPRKLGKLSLFLNRRFDKFHTYCNQRLTSASKSRKECRVYVTEKLGRHAIGRWINKSPVRRVLPLVKHLANKLSRPMWKFGCRVSDKICRVTLKTTVRCKSDQEYQTNRVIEDCDVWLIPYVGLERPFSKPTVVTIHDLVCFHFPEMLSAEALAEFKRISTQVAKQSTVAACVSNFIASNDLRGVLSLPDEKVRVVAPTAPRDFGELADLTEFANKYPVLDKPFVFYPAAFRGYKNHEILVEALSVLARQGDPDLQLVFTGIHDTPEKLTQLIAQRGLSNRVQILGKIDREAMSLFYSRAQATVVPSLYEQGSFPLMEAMYWKCPIASSNIPQLQELFAVMGDSMLYFDPHSHVELAKLLRQIQANRAAIVEQQQRYRQDVFGRTWESASDDWIDVFQYAIALEETPQSHEGLPADPESAGKLRTAA